MSIQALMRLFPLVAIGLTACSSLVAKSDYPIAHLYDYYWVESAKPGEQQTTASIAQRLVGYDVIVFGEVHGHPGVHLAQIQLLKHLHLLNPNLSLSLEQFERDTQPVLDEYLDDKIGEQKLRDKARAWENYPISYRPLMEYAKRHDLPVIAANAPKDAVICVGRKGLAFLDTLPEEERRHIAKTIDVSDGAYKDQYMAFINNNVSHGGGSSEQASAAMQAMAERSFAAQVVRDETMAESIAKHRQDHPQRQMLHLTGHFHSEGFLGTVEKLLKRVPQLKIAVINPILLSDESPSWNEEDLATGTVLLLVEALPKKFVQQDNAMQWSLEILQQRKESECAIQSE